MKISLRLDSRLESIFLQVPPGRSLPSPDAVHTEMLFRLKLQLYSCNYPCFKCIRLPTKKQMQNASRSITQIVDQYRKSR